MRKPQTPELIDKYRSTLDQGVEPSTAEINITVFKGKIAVSVNELALHLGVSTRTVERMLKRREIMYKKAGRRVVIPVSAVEAWLNQKD